MAESTGQLNRLSFSKRGLFQQLSSQGHSSPDIVLFLHCIDILVPQSHAQPEEAYMRAKQCFRELEDQGIISIRVLQAAMLLAYYEIGHAIYPAAYFRVGHCARIGHALGIYDRRNVTQMFPIPMSWTAMEEIRRIWWGVIILDRFVNLGVPDRPFSCADANPEDLLPMDDNLWDLGEQTVTASLAVSSNTDLQAPPFARTCQAAHLVSRVISHTNTSNKNRSPAEYYSEALQLHGILTSFKLALDQEVNRENPGSYMLYAPARGLCASALIALCDNHTCADLDDVSGVGTSEQLKIQQEALSTLHDICGSVRENASQLLQKQDSQYITSPLSAESLYTAATNFGWYIAETGKTELTPAVDDLKNALHLIGRSWKLGVLGI
ncbi:fungal specific transcription factor [Fusarium albosuccineum]|uniref:Fungal specific transcription factor n=1 Tax=Fusarium albosuccineum TaxID=1237068 RepID=A0A8H4PEX0_9HYPO|nr:fungal specific transcription factor [Fusarium albosuccineum]